MQCCQLVRLCLTSQISRSYGQTDLMKNLLKSDFLIYYMYIQTGEHIHKDMFKTCALKMI